MKTIKENWENIIMFLGEILVGILLLINPIGFTSAIIIISGVILTILGILNIIKYIKAEPLEAMYEQSLAKGLIFGLLGLFCIFHSEWFVITFPVITMLYGLVALVTGLKKVQWTFDLLRIKRGNWFLVGLSAVLSILFGVVIIYNPFGSTAILWQFTGIAFIVESIFDIVAIVLSKSKKDEEENI